MAAGTKSATAKVTGQPGPSVTLTCSVGAVTNCATATVGQSVLFTAQRATTSSVLSSSTLDFGDGTSIDLGTLASPVNCFSCVYPNRNYTARLTVTDVNGETSSAAQIVQVGTAASASVSAANTAGRDVTATATVTGAIVTQYAWTFEGTTPNVTTTTIKPRSPMPPSGTKTVSVTVTLGDGRTVTASTSVVVP